MINPTERITFQSLNAKSPRERRIANHMPIACALFNEAKTGYVPAIHYPARTVAHLQWARFPRKTKMTAIEAIAYAEKVILYRQLKLSRKA